MLTLPNMGQAKRGKLHGQRFVPVEDVPRFVQQAHEELLAEGKYPGIKQIQARVRVGIAELGSVRRALIASGAITVPRRPDRRGMAAAIPASELPGRILEVARELLAANLHPTIPRIQARLGVSNAAICAARNLLVETGQLPELTRNLLRKPRTKRPAHPRTQKPIQRFDRVGHGRTPGDEFERDVIFVKGEPMDLDRIVERVQAAERNVLGHWSGV